MNKRDMKIQTTESGFIVTYRSDIISTAEANWYTGTISFLFKTGKRVNIDVSEFIELSPYNGQFGLTLTDNGTHFFVQSWKAGLFCFDIQTGRLLWHNKQSKAYHTATKGDLLLCHYYWKNVCIIDVLTGEIIQKYPFTSGTVFLPLSADFFLIGPKRGCYEVLDFNLKRQVKLPIAELNPKGWNTFIIQEATLLDRSIVISGVEYTNTEFISAVRAKKGDAFIDNRHFVREIPVYFPTLPHKTD